MNIYMNIYFIQNNSAFIRFITQVSILSGNIYIKSFLKEKIKKISNICVSFIMNIYNVIIIYNICNNKYIEFYRVIL